ncbi:MAG: DMT family transporter [Lawsonibacter sp.]|nr:DMT family transporter [Lawsonibacter sp.]
MKLTPRYQFYAAVTIVFWSLAYPMTTIAMRDFSSFGLAFLRYAIAGLLILAIVWLKKLKLPAPRDLGWFFACGLAGFVLYPIFFNYGCTATPSSVSSTMIAITPLITAAAARFWFGERLVLLQWGSILLAFGGVLVLLLKPGEHFSANTLWLLGAAVCLAAYNLMQRKLTGQYSSLQASAFSILAGALLLLPFSPRGLADLLHASAAGIISMVVLGIFSSAVAYVSWAKAFSIAPSTSSVSNYMFLAPFLATLLGFFISGELPTGRTLVGGAIILTGMFFFQRLRKKAETV